MVTRTRRNFEQKARDLCEKAGWDFYEIVDRNRSFRLCYRRMMVCLVLRSLGASWHETGEAIRRTHATAIHYCSIFLCRKDRTELEHLKQLMNNKN